MGLTYCRSLRNVQIDIIVITMIYDSHLGAWHRLHAKKCSVLEHLEIPHLEKRDIQVLSFAGLWREE